MKIIYKCVLRKSIRNIIRYKNLGADSGSGMVPFRQHLQRLQRQILYWGIVTKNTQDQTLLNPIDKSESCKEIITNLQKLKRDRRISVDACHIMLEELSEWRVKNHDRIAMKNKILTDFDVQARYELGKPDPNLKAFTETFDRKR